MSEGNSPPSGSGAAADSIVLEEEIDPNYIPSETEIVDYAKWMGMDLENDRDLFWIAREGLMAPLPANWKPCKTKDTEDIYYFNFATGESTWDHPCDGYYKRLYEEEKKKKEIRLKEQSDEFRSKAKQDVAQIIGKKDKKKKAQAKLDSPMDLKIVDSPSLRKPLPDLRKPPLSSSLTGSLAGSFTGSLDSPLSTAATADAKVESGRLPGRLPEPLPLAKPSPAPFPSSVPSLSSTPTSTSHHSEHDAENKPGVYYTAPSSSSAPSSRDASPAPAKNDRLSSLLHHSPEAKTLPSPTTGEAKYSPGSGTSTSSAVAEDKAHLLAPLSGRGLSSRPALGGIPAHDNNSTPLLPSSSSTSSGVVSVSGGGGGGLEVQMLSQQASSLSQQVSGLQADRVRLQETLAGKDVSLGEARADVLRLEHDLQTARQDKSLLQMEKTSLLSIHQKLQATIDGLHAQLAAATEAALAASTANSTSSTTNPAQPGLVSPMASEREMALQQQVRDAELKSQQLELKSQQLELKSQQLELKSQQLELKSQQLQDEVRVLEARLQQQTASLAEADKRVSSRQADCVSLQGQVAESRETIASLKVQLATATAALQQMTCQLNDRTGRVQALEASLKGKEREAAEVGSRLEALQEEHAKCSRHLLAMPSLSPKPSEREDLLQQQREEKEEHEHAMQALRSQHAEAVSQLESRIRCLQSDLQTARQQQQQGDDLLAAHQAQAAARETAWLQDRQTLHHALLASSALRETNNNSTTATPHNPPAEPAELLLLRREVEELKGRLREVNNNTSTPPPAESAELVLLRREVEELTGRLREVHNNSTPTPRNPPPPPVAIAVGEESGEVLVLRGEVATLQGRLREAEREQSTLRQAYREEQAARLWLQTRLEERQRETEEEDSRRVQSLQRELSLSQQEAGQAQDEVRRLAALLLQRDQQLDEAHRAADTAQAAAAAQATALTAQLQQLQLQLQQLQVQQTGPDPGPGAEAKAEAVTEAPSNKLEALLTAVLSHVLQQQHQPPPPPPPKEEEVKRDDPVRDQPVEKRPAAVPVPVPIPAPIPVPVQAPIPVPVQAPVPVPVPVPSPPVPPSSPASLASLVTYSRAFSQWTRQMHRHLLLLLLGTQSLADWVSAYRQPDAVFSGLLDQALSTCLENMQVHRHHLRSLKTQIARHPGGASSLPQTNQAIALWNASVREIRDLQQTARERDRLTRQLLLRHNGTITTMRGEEEEEDPEEEALRRASEAVVRVHASLAEGLERLQGTSAALGGSIATARDAEEGGGGEGMMTPESYCVEAWLSPLLAAGGGPPPSSSSSSLPRDRRGEGEVGPPLSYPYGERQHLLPPGADYAAVPLLSQGYGERRPVAPPLSYAVGERPLPASLPVPVHVPAPPPPPSSSSSSSLHHLSQGLGDSHHRLEVVRRQVALLSSRQDASYQAVESYHRGLSRLLSDVQQRMHTRPAAAEDRNRGSRPHPGRGGGGAAAAALAAAAGLPVFSL